MAAKLNRLLLAVFQAMHNGGTLVFGSTGPLPQDRHSASLLVRTDVIAS